jgi:hypothetical protein
MLLERHAVAQHARISRWEKDRFLVRYQRALVARGERGGGLLE